VWRECLCVESVCVWRVFVCGECLCVNSVCLCSVFVFACVWSDDIPVEYIEPLPGCNLKKSCCTEKKSCFCISYLATVTANLFEDHPRDILGRQNDFESV